MKRFQTVLGLSSILAAATAASMAPSIASAATVEKTYVACNQYGDCWRVHRLYAYGKDVPIRYYDGDWYTAHQSDTNIRWLPDPADDRGYYVEDRTWHSDPAARAVKTGAAGAGLGAAIGCLVTLPVGCAPGAAAGAAIGGGTGAVAGAATTPPN
jgi:hypothetical protein